MAEQHQIKITIKTDGSLSSEVIGVTGSKCTTLSGWVNQLGQVLEDRHTDDYYKPDEQALIQDNGF
jgi:uridine kinase